MIKFNLNYDVRVKIKPKGIEHYVNNHNKIMPLKLHTSYREFEAKADPNGYHTMQLHTLMDNFGCEGLGLSQLIDMEILLEYPNYIQFHDIFKNSKPLGDFESEVLKETIRRLSNSEPTLPGRK